MPFVSFAAATFFRSARFFHLRRIFERTRWCLLLLLATVLLLESEIAVASYQNLTPEGKFHSSSGSGVRVGKGMPSALRTSLGAASERLKSTSRSISAGFSAFAGIAGS